MIAHVQHVRSRCAALGVALVALLAALLLAAPTAYAEPTTYDVWVGGVQVTSDNADDVLGDGTVEFDYDSGTAYLYLSNATIPQALTNTGGWTVNTAIFADIDLDIYLYGDNALVPSDETYTCNSIYGIVVDGDLGIYGYDSGTLTVTAEPGENVTCSYGATAISAYDNIYICDAKVDIAARTDYDNYGIYNYGYLNFYNSEVIVVCDNAQYSSEAIYGSEINVAYGSSVTAIAGNSTEDSSIGIAAYSLYVYDVSSVVAQSGSAEYFSAGISVSDLYAYDNASILAMGGAADASYGIYAYYDILINDYVGLQAYGEDLALGVDPDLEYYVRSGALVNTEASADPADAEIYNGPLPLGGTASPFKFVRLPGPGVIFRVAGDTANETAAAIADMGFSESEWVVLAREDDFADALGATGLAGTLQCPIILTDRESLSEAAADAINEHGATKCYIIGGTGAMKEQLETDLKAQTEVTEITRLWGENSYDTSLACAKEIVALGGHSSTAIVAMSTNFQDALSISPIAYRYKVPVILQTWGDTSADRGFTDDAAAWLEGKDLIVVGGTGAISDESVAGYEVYTRLWGETGYDTSNEIAKWAVQENYLNPSSAVIACGAQAPKGVDALAGAALAGKIGCPILLVNSNEAMEPADLTVIEYLSRNSLKINTTFVLGGTYVVPADLYDLIAKIVVALELPPI